MTQTIDGDAYAKEAVKRRIEFLLKRGDLLPVDVAVFLARIETNYQQTIDQRARGLFDGYLEIDKTQVSAVSPYLLALIADTQNPHHNQQLGLFEMFFGNEEPRDLWRADNLVNAAIASAERRVNMELVDRLSPSDAEKGLLSDLLSPERAAGKERWRELVKQLVPQKFLDMQAPLFGVSIYAAAAGILFLIFSVFRTKRRVAKYGMDRAKDAVEKPAQIEASLNDARESLTRLRAELEEAQLREAQAQQRSEARSTRDIEQEITAQEKRIAELEAEAQRQAAVPPETIAKLQAEEKAWDKHQRISRFRLDLQTALIFSFRMVLVLWLAASLTPYLGITAAFAAPILFTWIFLKIYGWLYKNLSYVGLSIISSTLKSIGVMVGNILLVALLASAVTMSWAPMMALAGVAATLWAAILLQPGFLVMAGMWGLLVILMSKKADPQSGLIEVSMKDKASKPAVAATEKTTDGRTAEGPETSAEPKVDGGTVTPQMAPRFDQDFDEKSASKVIIQVRVLRKWLQLSPDEKASGKKFSEVLKNRKPGEGNLDEIRNLIEEIRANDVVKRIKDGNDYITTPDGKPYFAEGETVVVKGVTLHDSGPSVMDETVFSFAESLIQNNFKQARFVLGINGNSITAYMNARAALKKGIEALDKKLAEKKITSEDHQKKVEELQQAYAAKLQGAKVNGVPVEDYVRELRRRLEVYALIVPDIRERLQITLEPGQRKPFPNVLKWGAVTMYGEDGFVRNRAGSKGGHMGEVSANGKNYVLTFKVLGRRILIGMTNAVIERWLADHGGARSGDLRFFLPSADQPFFAGVIQMPTSDLNEWLDEKDGFPLEIDRMVVPLDEAREDEQLLGQYYPRQDPVTGELKPRVIHSTTVDGGNYVSNGSLLTVSQALADRPDVGGCQMDTGYHTEDGTSMDWVQRRFAHHSGFTTIKYNAAVSGYERFFGKYTLKTRWAGEMARPSEGLPWGAYYTRTVILSGFIIGAIKRAIKEGKQSGRFASGVRDLAGDGSVLKNELTDPNKQAVNDIMMSKLRTIRGLPADTAVPLAAVTEAQLIQALNETMKDPALKGLIGVMAPRAFLQATYPQGIRNREDQSELDQDGVSEFAENFFDVVNGIIAKMNGEDEIVTSSPSDNYVIHDYVRRNIDKIRRYYAMPEGWKRDWYRIWNLGKGMEIPLGWYLFGWWVFGIVRIFGATRFAELRMILHRAGTLHLFKFYEPIPFGNEFLDTVSVDYFNGMFEHMRTHPVLLQGMNSALVVRADKVPGIIDDTQENLKKEDAQVDKSTKANDRPTDWLLEAGTFALTKPSDFFNIFPREGMQANKQWLKSLILSWIIVFFPALFILTATQLAVLQMVVVLSVLVLAFMWGAFADSIGHTLANWRKDVRLLREGMWYAPLLMAWHWVLMHVWFVKDVLMWCAEKVFSTLKYMARVLNFGDFFWGHPVSMEVFERDRQAPPALPALGAVETPSVLEYVAQPNARRGIIFGMVLLAMLPLAKALAVVSVGLVMVGSVVAGLAFGALLLWNVLTDKDSITRIDKAFENVATKEPDFLLGLVKGMLGLGPNAKGPDAVAAFKKASLWKRTKAIWVVGLHARGRVKALIKAEEKAAQQMGREAYYPRNAYVLVDFVRLRNFLFVPFLFLGVVGLLMPFLAINVPVSLVILTLPLTFPWVFGPMGQFVGGYVWQTSTYKIFGKEIYVNGKTKAQAISMVLGSIFLAVGVGLYQASLTVAHQAFAMIMEWMTHAPFTAAIGGIVEGAIGIFMGVLPGLSPYVMWVQTFIVGGMVVLSAIGILLMIVHLVISAKGKPRAGASAPRPPAGPPAGSGPSQPTPSSATQQPAASSKAADVKTDGPEVKKPSLRSEARERPSAERALQDFKQLHRQYWSVVDQAPATDLELTGNLNFSIRDLIREAQAKAADDATWSDALLAMRQEALTAIATRAQKNGNWAGNHANNMAGWILAVDVPEGAHNAAAIRSQYLDQDNAGFRLVLREAASDASKQRSLLDLLDSFDLRLHTWLSAPMQDKIKSMKTEAKALQRQDAGPVRSEARVLTDRIQERLDAGRWAGAGAIDAEARDRYPITELNFKPVFGDLKFVNSENPGRAARESGSAKPTVDVRPIDVPDDEMIGYARIPGAQNLFVETFEGLNGDSQIEVNVNRNANPLRPDHVLFFPKVSEQYLQSMTPSALHLMLTISEELGEESLLGFNSIRAGASVRQLHFQAFVNAPEPFAIEWAGRTKAAEDRNGVTVERFTDYPAGALIFSGQDRKALAAAAGDYLKVLKAADVPYNVVARRESVYVFPRSRVRDSLFPGRVAFAELAGQFYVDEKDVTEKRLAEALRTETASPELFEALLQAYETPDSALREDAIIEVKARAIRETEAVRSEVRAEEVVVPDAEAAMQAALDALQSVQEQKLEITVGTEVLSVEALQAEQAVIRAVMNAFDVESVPAFADQTRVLVPFDAALINAVRLANPKALVTVVVADAATVEQAKNSGIAGIQVVMNADLDITSLARGEAKEIGIVPPVRGVSKSVVQVLKRDDAPFTAEDLRAAALVGQMGGVVAVVGFKKSVGFATQLQVAEILSIAMQAAQAIAKSA
ncbi:MAG: hypothetical protein KTQ49_01310 [Candidatus Omnitrophica bacterium]|nr:hypothetical protein [Candidatus Omnitrophota bacterium]